jgi:cell division transport system permease protein
VRIEYFFRETASGLRRNGVVAFAAISTAFIALFLFGLSLLIARQLNLIIEAYTGNVEVAVYLTDPPRPETVASITEILEALPAVESTEYMDKEESYERFVLLFQSQPEMIENANPDAIPASIRVHLADDLQYEQVTAALGCEPNEQGVLVCSYPGIREVADHRELLTSLKSITRYLWLGVVIVAGIMLVSAIFLVANTLRMGMFARRKEIGIMRLVGATNWRIRTPFLIEGLVEALVGGVLAILFLFGLKVVSIDQLDTLRFLPLVRNTDVLSIAPFILVAAVAVAAVAGTIGMRRFLDV